MLPWWEKWPGRLEAELEAIKAYGIICEMDQKAFESGRVVLHLEHQVGEELQEFIVIYPDTYPYFRFEIFAPGLNLNHHQNPFEKNLCLIGRSTENWKPSDTAATFIKNRLPKVIQTGIDIEPDEAMGIEETQGEPISDYYGYAPASIVLIDSSWAIDPAIDGGFLVIGSKPSVTNRCNLAVVKVMDRDKNVIENAEPEIVNLFPNNIGGRWIRLTEPIVEKNPSLILGHIRSVNPNILNYKQKMLSGKLVIGILFPEEVIWRKSKDSWLFLVLD